MADWKVTVEDNKVRFYIGVQSFTIDYHPDEDNMEESNAWMAKMLHHALSNLAQNEAAN